MNRYARSIINSRMDRMRDYEDYASRDYAYDRRMDYAYDRRDGRRDYRGSMDYDMRDYRGDYRRDYSDYAADGSVFPKKEMARWKKRLGEHFTKDQIKQYANKTGVDVEEFGEDVYCLTMNMMYSDYCKVAKKFGLDTPEFYLEMAKAFLNDEDFDGEGDEKLYLYYKVIASKDE